LVFYWLNYSLFTLNLVFKIWEKKINTTFDMDDNKRELMKEQLEIFKNEIDALNKARESKQALIT